MALSPLLLCLALSGSGCADFRARLEAACDFRPSVATEAEQARTTEALDALRDELERHRELMPCLEAAVRDPKAGPFLRYEGAALLAEGAPTRAHKALQARLWGEADLAEVDAGSWIATLAALGAEGYDVTEGARRWLAQADATFALPAQGLYGRLREGARLLFGSLDEAEAFPVLEAAAQDPAHPNRELAMVLLARLGTPEARAVLRELRVGVPPPRVPAGSRPSAPDLRHALVRAAAGDWKPFEALKAGDLTGILDPRDLPLLRRARRQGLVRATAKALADDDRLTRAILALLPEMP